MPKKRKKTDSSKKSGTTKRVRRDSEIEHALLKNLVELQKINTDLAEKFDHLAKEISQLLALFELTARNFAKNAPIGEYEKDKDFLDKIDKLLDQNKILAKGLSIMEERLRERMYGQNAPAEKPKMPEERFDSNLASRGKPLPRF